MARPPLAVGTAGKIRTTKTAAGYKARCLIRDYDGKSRDIERNARTKAAAEAALKLALRDRSRIDANGEITPETRIAALAEAWYVSLEDRSPNTMEAYRRRLDDFVIPSLGRLKIRELSIGVLDRHLRAVSAAHGPAMAKMTRSVLSGMCGLAARHDAIDRNPVRDVGAISSKPKKAPRAMTIEQVRDLRTKLAQDEKAVGRDLPDFVAFMLATGLRIGETAAVTWDALDLDAGIVEVRGTVIRLKGRGLWLKPAAKSRAGSRTLALPSWCVEMLRRRRDNRPKAFRADVTPVFTAPLGGLRDPSNTQADLREAFDAAGYGWVTSHSLRKTTATLLDGAGLSARAIADQLGHANPSLTQDVYLGRKVASTGAATVLEAISSF